MIRALPLAILATTLVACLPTRDRFEFGPGSSNSADAETTSDSGGMDDTGEAGDAGMNPNGQTGSDAALDTGGTSDTGAMSDACIPETDDLFCQRLAVECGVYEGTDNCGEARMANCGGCAGAGVGCNAENVCIETDCIDNQDNDGAGGADCDDPNCLGEVCHPNQMRTCQAGGACQ